MIRETIIPDMHEGNFEFPALTTTMKPEAIQATISDILADIVELQKDKVVMGDSNYGAKQIRELEAELKSFEAMTKPSYNKPRVPEEKPSVLASYNPEANTRADTRLYYLKVEAHGEVFYKIGVTRQTVAERYQGRKENITVLYDVKLNNAYQVEGRIKEDFKAQNYPIKILGTQGTEVYKLDILNLDN